MSDGSLRKHWQSFEVDSLDGLTPEQLKWSRICWWYGAGTVLEILRHDGTTPEALMRKLIALVGECNEFRRSEGDELRGWDDPGRSN